MTEVRRLGYGQKYTPTCATAKSSSRPMYSSNTVQTHMARSIHERCDASEKETDDDDGCNRDLFWLGRNRFFVPEICFSMLPVLPTSPISPISPMSLMSCMSLMSPMNCVFIVFAVSQIS